MSKFENGFVPIPDGVLSLDCSANAKLLFGLLLRRSIVSAKNGWRDQSGRIFVIFPISALSANLGVSDRTVQNSLKELEELSLCSIKRDPKERANKIFLNIDFSDIFEGEKISGEGENLSGEGEKITGEGVKKLPR